MNMRLLLTIFFLLPVFTHDAGAQPDQNVPIERLLPQWNATIEQSNQQLASPELDDETLKRLRAALSEIRDEARLKQGEIYSETDPLHEELNALGPPPAEGAPKESQRITKKRMKLTERIAAIEGQAKEAELIFSRADKTLKQLSRIRIDQFTRKIFSRGFSAAAPEVWYKAVPEILEKAIAVKQRFHKWHTDKISTDELQRTILHLLLTVFVVLVTVWPFSRWFCRHYGRVSKTQAPTYLELLRAALVMVFNRVLLPMVVLISTFLVLEHDLQWSKFTREIAFSTVQAILMILLVTAISRAMIAPVETRWRLIPLDDDNARYIHKIIIGLAWVFAVDLLLNDWMATISVSLELTIVRKFLIGLFIAALLLALLLRRQLWRSDIAYQKTKGYKTPLWHGFRGLIAVLVLLIPISAIAGYVAFSRLLGTQIVLTGGLLLLAGIIIAFSSELIRELLDKETVIGSKIRQNLELTDDGSKLLAFWLKAAANLIIYFGALLTLLVIWGAGGEDLNEWLYTALFGFKIAGFTISIATIFFAVALFSTILLVTRLLQRFLEHRILPQTRMDPGIQHSIRASVGYIGFIIATVFAISTLGIDLTKLAIIAGALSVGIGFGLQNVVNNFVSGLILLFERPIKVGDWVVVGDKQGYVKKIKVRATEIETFDRASIFIPNSDLISNPLLNWTHADKTGRVIVPIGVAYGTDTGKVHNILLDVARSHPAVFRSPAPSVIFKGFGDSCLNFELRAYILDVDRVVAVRSDLCFEIDAAFRKEAIEIPYPQQDVHWRDIDRLENLVVKILSEKKL